MVGPSTEGRAHAFAYADGCRWQIAGTRRILPWPRRAKAGPVRPDSARRNGGWRPIYSAPWGELLSPKFVVS
jgi:hypothetical protein